jgi:hypothetical protein
MPEPEGDRLGGPEIREPIPRKRAFGGDDEIVSVRRHGLEKRLGVDVPWRGTSTGPVASRMQTFIVFTWRSIPQ